MKLHHIGIVVDDIKRYGTRYAEYLGLRPLSPIVADPIQRVRVQFWGNGREVSLELIQPLDDDSPVSRFLEKGGGLNHLCFEVEDITAAVEQAQAKGAICVGGPAPAAAFDGRHIAFLFFRDIGLVEFVEVSL